MPTQSIGNHINTNNDQNKANEEIENYYIINLIRRIQRSIRVFLYKGKNNLIGLNNENYNISFISSNNYSSINIKTKSKKDLILKTVSNFPLINDDKKSSNTTDNLHISNNTNTIHINNYYNLTNAYNDKQHYYLSTPKNKDNSKIAKMRNDSIQYKTQPNLNFNFEESKIIYF